MRKFTPDMSETRSKTDPMALWKAGAPEGCESEDCISGFYNILLHGLRCFAPELMKGVQVMWQGEAILKGPRSNSQGILRRFSRGLEAILKGF